MLLGKEKVWWLFFILQEDSHVQNVRSFPEEESSLDSVSRSDGRTAANKEKQMWGTLRFWQQIPISNAISFSAKFKAESSTRKRVIFQSEFLFLPQRSFAKTHGRRVLYASQYGVQGRNVNIFCDTLL